MAPSTIPAEASAKPASAAAGGTAGVPCDSAKAGSQPSTPWGVTRTVYSTPGSISPMV